jgi:hypothetical protein
MLKFCEGVRVGDLKIEELELEVLCADSTALCTEHSLLCRVMCTLIVHVGDTGLCY